MGNNSGWNEIDDEGITWLHKLSTLKELDLSLNTITWKGVQTLSQGNFPYLQSLNLCKKGIILAYNLITDQGLIFLHEFATLEKLSLWSTGVTEKGVQILTRAGHLHELLAQGWNPLKNVDKA